MSEPSRRPMKPATALVHGGTLRSSFGELSEALYLTQSFAYPSAEAAEARFKGDDPGFIYSRFSNPTVAMFETRMCLLEGAEAARATASGMAAVTAAMLSQVKAGDHVVAARALFGSCLYIVEELLPRFGVETTLVDGADLAEWKKAVRKETKVFFLETPTNPGLEVYDLKAIADLAHEAGARLVVDNVFASPLLQKPLAFGADIVVYSATKHIDGQGRCLGAGAHIDPDEAGALDGAIGLGLHLVLEVLLWRHARHVDALARRVELPAVIEAADTAFLVAAEEQRGAAVRAAMIHHANAATAVAEGDQLLAQQHEPHRRSVALELRGLQRRHPVFAHQRAHRRTGPDPGELGAFARGRHACLLSGRPDGTVIA